MTELPMDSPVEQTLREPHPAVATAQAAVIGMTFAGKVTLWSAGAEQMFGWTRAEAIDQPIGELADWGLDGQDFAEFVFFGASGVWIREHEVVPREGPPLILKTTASLVVGADGQDELIASIAPVEAGEHGVEQPLRERPFRAVAERGGDLVVICDRSMTINYVGPSLRQLFGYQPRSVIGTSGWRYVNPSDLRMLRREWDLALRNPGSHREVEFRLRDASGNWRQVQMRISNLVADLAISAMVLNIRDVTEQRQLAEALARSERLLQSILDAAIEGVWATDPSGSTVFANARMAELLAVDQTRLAAGSVFEFFDEAASESVRQRMKNRAAGVREQYELSFVRLDGQRRWFRVSAVPRYDLAGNFIGGLGMWTDVTERKLLERKVGRVLPSEHRDITTDGDRDTIASDDPGGQRAQFVADRHSEVDYGRTPSYERSAQLTGSSVAPDGGAPPVPGLDRLSRREVEVVRMLLVGDRVPVIAQHLFVSQSTVRNHLSSVFRKLRVSSQQELIVLLRERDATLWSHHR